MNRLSLSAGGHCTHGCHAVIRVFILALAVVGDLILSKVSDVPQVRQWTLSTASDFTGSDPAPAPAGMNASWTAAPTVSLSKHTAVYDSDADQVITFGGADEDSALPGVSLETVLDKIHVYDFASNTWWKVPTPPSGPAPRQEHVAWWAPPKMLPGGIVDRKARMYIHGGTAQTDPFGDLWCLEDGAWAQVNCSACPRLHGHTATVIGEHVYIFGGVGPGQVMTNALFRFHLESDTIEQISVTGELPSARAFHAAAAMVTAWGVADLYVLGGLDGHRVEASMYAFDTTTDAWRLVNMGVSHPTRTVMDRLVQPVVTPPLMRHACVAVFPMILCQGGADKGTPLTVSFDVIIGRWMAPQWSNLPELPPLIDAKPILRRLRSGDAWDSVQAYFVGGMTGSLRKFTTVPVVRAPVLSPPCPDGFVDPMGDGRCYGCPPGFSIDPRNSHACFACLAGYYEESGVCIKCPLSTYQTDPGAANVSSCTPCPPGKFTIEEGADSVDKCIRCPPGYYTATGRCEPCPAGTYGVDPDSQFLDVACAPCPFGEWSAGGGTSCTACPAGSSTGMFIERLSPHHKVQYSVGVVAPGGSYDENACPTRTPDAPLSVVYAGGWFWIQYWVYDAPSPGRTDEVTRDRRKTFAEFEGPTHPAMYHNCPHSSRAAPRSCKSVAERELSSVVSSTQVFQTCDSQIQSWAFRFDSYGPATVTISASGLLPLKYSFNVVPFPATRVEVDGAPASAIVGTPLPLRFYALNFKGDREQFTNKSFQLGADCGGSPATLSIGSTASSIHTLELINGFASAAVTVTDDSTNCKFWTDAGTRETDDVTWTAQKVASMQVSLRRSLTTNFGLIHVVATMLDARGDQVLGDSESRLAFELVSADAADLVISQPETFVTVAGGQLVRSLQIYTKDRNPPALAEFSARIEVKRVNDDGVSVSPVRTAPFDLNVTDGRGDKIVIIEDRHPVPAALHHGMTMMVEVAIVNEATGEHDSADATVRVQLDACLTVIIGVGNSTVLEIPIVAGHAVLPVTFAAGEGTNCLLHLTYADADRSVAGVFTRQFDVVKRASLRTNFTTGDCANVPLGSVQYVEVCTHDAGGAKVTSDDMTVIKMTTAGDFTGDAEQSIVGESEQRLVGGCSTFTFRVLPVASGDMAVNFLPGWWRRKDNTNATYWALPHFRYRFDDLGTTKEFEESGDIASVSVCPPTNPLTPTVASDRLLVPTRAPTWVEHGEPLVFDVHAVDQYGFVDESDNDDLTLEIRGCHVGHPDDFAWQYYASGSGNPTALPARSAKNWGKLVNGRATVSVVGRYLRASGLESGLMGCNVLVRAGSARHTAFGGFQVRRLHRACTLCAPGYWSPGGNGRTASVAKHLGGCVPCLLGTFSTQTGSADESSCRVCAKSYGFRRTTDNRKREGIMECESCVDEETTTGVTGGGACPAASIVDVASADWWFRLARYGTLGRYCALGLCSSGTPLCATGTHYALCRDFRNRDDCEGQQFGLTSTSYDSKLHTCWWDPRKERCEGDAWICPMCPPGTGNWHQTSSRWSCRQCDAGGWSSNNGHTQIDRTSTIRERYRCRTKVAVRNRHCYGEGSGICPDGTYSPTVAATSPDTCQACRPGTFGSQRRVKSYNACPASCASIWHNELCPPNLIDKTCYQCPARDNGALRGQYACHQCPEGTFNPREGMKTLADCLPCPQAHHCPGGTALPILSDAHATHTGYDSMAQPTHVGYPGGVTPHSCANLAAPHPGYVQDGTMTLYDRFWRHDFKEAIWIDRWTPTMWPEAGMGPATDKWTDIFDTPEWAPEDRALARYWYDEQDRLGDAKLLSGSLRCEKNGCAAEQKISIEHMMPMPFLARLWVRNDYVAEATGSATPGASGAFVGFVVTIEGEEPGQTLTVSQSVDTNDGATRDEWQEITAPIPEQAWAVKRARFVLLARGVGSGTAHFDDASLVVDPAVACKCAAGYFYNASNAKRPCHLCPAGFACATGAIVRCVGSWATASTPACQFCREGWLCDNDGRGRLIPCAKYTYLDTGTGTCLPCPVGHSCRDGKKYECNSGKYGDGGLECRICNPGFISPDSGPQRECTPCPAGQSSNPMRNACAPCEPNHFSGGGEVCTQCPKGQFVLSAGSAVCESCLVTSLMTVSHVVYRNGITGILSVPRACEDYYDWRVERFVVLSGGELGTVTTSRQSPSIRLYAKNTVGDMEVEAFVTSGNLEPEQRVVHKIHIENRAPLVVADDLVPLHNKAAQTLDISGLLVNDIDYDNDPVVLADIEMQNPKYGARNVQTNADRSRVTIDLPAGFIGPVFLRYRVMDAQVATPADCVAPNCRFSEYVKVKIQPFDAPPLARDDHYDVMMGEVYSFDVLVNDEDIDGDEVSVISAERVPEIPGLKGMGIASVCGRTCGSRPPCAGVFDEPCVCKYDGERGKCWPSHGRQHVISYTAPVERCGADSFQYTIDTFDGTAVGVVNAVVKRCFCGAFRHTMDIVFLVDETTDVRGWDTQMEWINSLQRRSKQSAEFRYSIIGSSTGRVIYSKRAQYFDIDYLDRSTATTFTPEVGVDAAMTAVGNALAKHSVVVVIFASQDAAIPADFEPAWNTLSAKYENASLITAVPRTDVEEGVWSFLRAVDRRYDAVARSWGALNTAEVIHGTMDSICSL